MAREANTRPRRTPVEGYRNRLGVRGKDPAYEYRIVNDIDDRVERFKEGGWEPVTDTGHSIGDRRVDKPAEEGSVKTVSVGGGVTGVLMRIKKEWFDEDQKLKAKRVDELENTTRQEARQNADYGSLKIER